MRRTHVAGAVVALALVAVTAVGVLQHDSPAPRSFAAVAGTPGLATDYLATVTATRCWPPTPAPDYSDVTVVSAATEYAATDATPYSVQPVCGEVQPSMAFVTDTFTDTSGTDLNAHTGELGATWTRNSASSTVDGLISNANRFRGGSFSNAVGIYTASGTPASADYDVQADVFVLSAKGLYGVLGRCSTSVFTYYGAFYYAADTSWHLTVNVAGSNTTLGTFSQVLTNGNTYVVKLHMVGTAISLYVDGVLRIGPITDSAVTAAGKAGVVFFGDGTAADNATQYQLDNFSATDPAGTTSLIAPPPYRAMMALLVR